MAIAIAAAVVLPLLGSTAQAAQGARPARHVAAPVIHPRLANGLTLTVNTTANTNDVSPSSGPCADTSHRCSLLAAFQIADARQVPVTIHVPAGTYVLAFTLTDYDAAGVSVIGASPSSTVVSGNFQYPPIIVGNASDIGAGSSLAGVPLALQGLTVEDGHSFTGGTWAGEGGCIIVASANSLLSLTSAHVRNCAATANGGGIWSIGRVMLDQSVVQNNFATVSGGGIFEHEGLLDVSASAVTGNVVTNGSSSVSGAGIFANSNFSVVASRIVGNVATGTTVYGGGAYLQGSGIVSGDTVSGNHAVPATSADITEGGGLYVEGAVEVVGSTVAGNQSLGQTADGGGIYSAQGLWLVGSHLSGNVANGATSALGGGVFEDTSGAISATTLAGNVVESAGGSAGGAVYDQVGSQIDASTFLNNAAVNGTGGALYVSGSSSHVTASTFSGNRATGGLLAAGEGPGFGGAVAAFGNAMLLANDVLRANHADQGGGGYFGQANLTMNSTLVVRNTAVYGAGVYNYWLVHGTGDAIIDNVGSGPGGAGAGLFNVGFTGASLVHSADLFDSVIAGNVAATGAGVYFQGGGSPSAGGLFVNDLIAGNRTAGGAPSECAIVGTAVLRPVSGGGNVTGDMSCGLTATTDRRGPAEQGVWFASPGGAVAEKGAATFGHGGALVTGLAAATGNQGYWELTSSGVVHGSGAAPTLHSAVGRLGGGTATAIAGTLDNGGYWVASSTGVVVGVGDARAFGGAPGKHIVALARSVDSNGYELLLATGSVRAFGDAPHLGSHAGILAASIAMTPDGQGYWEVSKSGQVFAFGDAKPYGSSAASGVVAIVATPNGRGYLLVTSHGAVLPHGNGHSPGSKPGTFTAAAGT